jgi:hypothetical protein
MNYALNELDTVTKTYKRLRLSCIFIYLLLLTCVQRQMNSSVCFGVFILENTAYFYNFCRMLLYGCAIWCLTLREELSLVVSDDTVVSKILGCKRDKVTRGGENSVRCKFLICTHHQIICEEMKIYSV